ncbi:MAG: hypothetical protein ACTHKU_15315, partial [Verrucomicrobiota bacterium]
VAVSGDATLGGNGIIGGAATVQFGGTLSPGNSVGRLTFNDNLSIEGVAMMEIARNGSALTNDMVTVLKTNSYGAGTLIVTNVGGSPLQVGDSFQLFSANNYSGAFAEIIYPEGYTFTNTLAADGRIYVASIVSAAPPTFVGGAVSRQPDGNISLTANGDIGSSYRLWASTNVALTPITTTWTLVTNGTVTVSPFTIIDNTATNYPQRFYLFSAP